MGKRRPTAGGEYDDGGSGETSGYDHRDHKPKQYTKRPWHRRSSATAAQRFKDETEEHRGFVSLFSFFGHPNRSRGHRRRP